MTASETQHADAAAQLKAIPGWSRMTAYDRTKALMDNLYRQGLDAPNWATIRTLIGKGSAGDINRAKRDFRKELGEQLARMRGAKGMPEDVSDACSKLWLLAVEQAARTFDEQVAAITADLEQAEAAQADAEAQRSESLARVEALEGEKAGLQASIQSLQALANAERVAKEHAQQMADAARQELADKLNETKAALANAQQETAQALTRFEGMEKRLQQEIDRSRQDLAAERVRMNKERAKEQAAIATAKDRAQAQITAEQAKRQDVERKLAATEAEVAELRRQLDMAQETIRKALSSKSPARKVAKKRTSR